MQRNVSCLLALLAAAMLPATGLAGTDSGFYIGGAAGQAKVGDIDASAIGTGSNLSFDGTDTGWKAFAGYNFGWIPFVDLAIEGGYIDFGKPNDHGLSIDANGWDLFGLVGVNLGPVGLFGKLGMVQWDADASGGGYSGSDDGTDPGYGVGLRMKFGSVEVRAEYEYFDISAADDVSLASIGAAWTF